VTRIGYPLRYLIYNRCMANLLEQEAERLKREYGPSYYKTIDGNLKSVSEQMSAAPGSIDISEGLIALCYGLPSLTRKRQQRRRRLPPKRGRKSL